MIRIKILLPALFLIFSISLSFAQEIHIGFQASPSYNWMGTNNNKINNNGSLIGLKLGLVGDYRLTDAYSLTGGLNFHFNTGGKLQFTLPGKQWQLSGVVDSTMPTNSSLKFNLTYLEIPMGLKMRTQPFGDFRYFAELPIITLGINTTASGTIEGTNFDQSKIDIGKEVRFLNFSWGLGGGIEYEVTSGTTLIGGLYYHQGFIDMTTDNGKILDPTKGAIPDNSRGTISNITLRLGVMF